MPAAGSSKALQDLLQCFSVLGQAEDACTTGEGALWLISTRCSQD